MRSLLIIASALFAFGATMTFEAGPQPTPLVCADEVVRAGCAGASWRIVVRKPVKVCKTVRGQRGEGTPLHLSPQTFSIERLSHAGLPQSGQPFAEQKQGDSKQAIVSGPGAAGTSPVKPRSLIIFL